MEQQQGQVTETTIIETPSPESTDSVVCPVCHVQVRQSDFFCFNCGKELHEKPEPVGMMTQVGLYVGSVLLPPMGIIWGIRYLRKPHRQAKIVGWIAIVLTVISLIGAIMATFSIVNQVNQQIEQQMQMLG